MEEAFFLYPQRLCQFSLSGLLVCIKYLQLRYYQTFGVLRWYRTLEVS